MTEQPDAPQVPLVDPGNPFLDASNVSVAIGVDHDTRRIVLTLRSGGGTMTVKLNEEMVDNLTNGLQAEKAKLATGLVIPNAAMDLSEIARRMSVPMSERFRDGR